MSDPDDSLSFSAIPIDDEITDETAIEPGSVSAEVTSLTDEAATLAAATQLVQYFPRERMEGIADSLQRTVDAGTDIRQQQALFIASRVKSQDIQNERDEALNPSRIRHERARNNISYLAGWTLFGSGFLVFLFNLYTYFMQPPSRFMWIGVYLMMAAVVVFIIRSLSDIIASLTKLIRP